LNGSVYITIQDGKELPVLLVDPNQDPPTYEISYY